ncbi:MAG TPA: hypothetical protein VFR94_15605 [Nitrososphaeraceae archaeon]|nr:hypothetical protein [Nitrososphaeraceae archaeon]
MELRKEHSIIEDKDSIYRIALLHWLTNMRPEAPIAWDEFRYYGSG